MNIHKPRVTVLMPVYNDEIYLGEAIYSILNQTFKDFEFLIVDDFLTDGSGKIIAEYAQKDPRIRLLKNRKAKGIVGALNTGIEEAMGEYIARMDSDDISLSERLEKQVVFLDKNPHVGVCGTWVELFGDHQGVIWQLPTEHEIIVSTMLFCGAIAHPTVMIRKKTFSENNFYYDNDYLYAEDYELWVRIAERVKLANIPEILLNYRTHTKNIGTKHNLKQVEISKRVRLNQILKLGICSSEEEMEIHQKLSNYHYEASKQFIANANSWLDKLITANEAKKIYSETAFTTIINQKRLEIERNALELHKHRSFKDMVKRMIKIALPATMADMVIRGVSFILNLKNKYLRTIRYKTEKIRVRIGLCEKLSKTVKKDFKIGMAVLAHERPDYLKLCLDTLFKTKLYNYDITFLISDDGSKDPRVHEIINQERNRKYKIVWYFTPKGPNCAGAAINKAARKLLEMDDFDMLGWCDPDAIFHPEWLDQTMKICLWAKKNHWDHVLGPFSSFNSSDYEFHRILGTYKSPYGNYVVKRQMGMLNYFYFKEDFLKLGFFAENENDETLMTEHFENLGVRNFCTETSYVEHIGQNSVLNQWRPTPVRRSVHGMNLATGDWGVDMEKISPYGFYRYLKMNDGFGVDQEKESNLVVDIIVPAIQKDLDVLPLTITSVRRYLRHPIGDIFVIGPKHDELVRFSDQMNCIFIDEDTVLPIRLKDINYMPQGEDRSGWIFQQLIKFNADFLSHKQFAFVIDADTILVQSQKFEHNGRTILLVSDECHFPYFETFKKIFKYETQVSFSFVAHQMIFDLEKLNELKRDIERLNDGTRWYQVILDNLDPNEKSSFSEYETYGNWMIKNHPESVSLEYWFNKSLPTREFKKFRLESNNYREYRSVSFHSYNKVQVGKLSLFSKAL